MDKLIIVYFFSNILFGFMGAILASIFNLENGVNYFGYIISNLIIFVYIIKEYKNNVLHHITQYKMKNNIAVLIAFSLMLLSGVIFSGLSIDLQASENKQLINNMYTENTCINFFIAITIVFIVPVVEEMVFRFHLIEKFDQKSLWLWVLISSLIFGLMHAGFDLPYLVFYSMHGLILSLAYVRTKNIFVPLFIHIINNGMATFF